MGRGVGHERRTALPDEFATSLQDVGYILAEVKVIPITADHEPGLQDRTRRHTALRWLLFSRNPETLCQRLTLLAGQASGVVAAAGIPQGELSIRLLTGDYGPFYDPSSHSIHISRGYLIHCLEEPDLLVLDLIHEFIHARQVLTITNDAAARRDDDAYEHQPGYEEGLATVLANRIAALLGIPIQKFGTIYGAYLKGWVSLAHVLGAHDWELALAVAQRYEPTRDAFLEAVSELWARKTGYTLPSKNRTLLRKAADGCFSARAKKTVDTESWRKVFPPLGRSATRSRPIELTGQLALQ